MSRRVRILPRDRLMGGLVGLVVGDALGVPVEFGTRGERDQDPVRGMRGYGTHHQPRGTWSDDGALAMAHAATFIAHGWDAEKHLSAFAAWYEDGTWSAHNRVFDVGATTLQAIRRFRDGQPAHEAGGRNDRDNGNGALMRILPAACWWANVPSVEAMNLLGEASALTHAHPRSRLCCIWHGLIAAGLLAGKSVSESLTAAVEPMRLITPASERRHFTIISSGACLALPRAAVPSDGYVMSTLVAVLWCLHQHEDFAEAVLAAVNLGGDADTTAAVVGGLAGLRCGLSGIPRAWTTCLPRRVAVLDLAERFAEACLKRG